MVVDALRIRFVGALDGAVKLLSRIVLAGVIPLPALLDSRLEMRPGILLSIVLVVDNLPKVVVAPS